jgi:hypothetical protein
MFLVLRTAQHMSEDVIQCSCRQEAHSHTCLLVTFPETIEELFETFNLVYFSRNSTRTLLHHILNLREEADTPDIHAFALISEYKALDTQRKEKEEHI